MGHGIGMQQLGGGAVALGQLAKVEFANESNLNDWTVVSPGGSSYTLDGGYLKISGSPTFSNGQNAIMYDPLITGLENYTIKVVGIVKSIGTGNAGPIVTIKADSTIASGPRKDSFVWYRNTASGGNGQGYRYFNDTTTLTPNAFISNPLTNTVLPVLDRRVELYVTKVGNSYTFKVVDTVTLDEEEGTITYTYANTSGQLDLQTSKIGIGTVGGDFWVESFEVTSDVLSGADWALVHNSIGAGYSASTLANRWWDQVQAANPGLTFAKTGGQGDRVDTVLSKQAELTLMAPKNWANHIATNQISQTSLASAQTDYATMVAHQVSLNPARIVHCAPLPRGGNPDMEAFKDWLLANYNTGIHEVRDWYTLLDNGSGSLDPAKDSGDGVHPNDSGHDDLSTDFNSIL